ncbi:MAG: helicase-exonuclease AddAB subunit AddB, partial [Selenomonadaceae bacterium]|nr:helicase-exonuclease AddAB subunit AddB [Selenomonadaceae bacterium]
MTAKLTALLGRSGSGKTTACLRAMRSRLLAQPNGPALVLVTQEHEVYQAERRLAACIPPAHGRGYLRAYVFGFRRLSEHILQETGGAALPRITDLGRRLLLRRVLERRQKDLTVFARAARQHGFGDELAGIIRECKSYGLTADALQEAGAQVKDPRLSGKLSDMALLLRDFESEMADKAADGEDRMQAFAARIPESALLRGAEIWIDGFTFFNPQERAVLAALLDTAAAVHVTFPMDPDLDAASNVRESGLFHRAYQTFLELGALAAEKGTALHIGRLTGFHRSAVPALVQIERELFHFPQRPLAGEAHGVQLVEAANPRLETEAVAADILRLLRDEGYRASDIGVLVRDAETYAGLLRR